MSELFLDPQYTFFTNGELQMYKACKRRWWLAYYRKLGSKNQKVTGALALGTKIHQALASYYGNGEDPLIVLQGLADRDYALLEDEDTKALDADTSLARVMLEGYLEWITETAADAGIRVIGPEIPIVANPQIPEHPNVRLLGKLDVRAERERDGARFLWDHKSCITFESVKKTAHMNHQFIHYHMLELLKIHEEGKSTDTRTDGALINMLRKVKRTATAKPPFYERIELRHNMETLGSYWRGTVETIRQIEAARDRLNAGEHHQSVCPPTPTDQCSWRCEFYSMCTMLDDGSRVEDYLSENYVSINPLKRYAPESIGVTN